MSDIKEICTITLLRHADDHIEAIVTSHPDGNDLEQMAKMLMELYNSVARKAKEEQA